MNVRSRPLEPLDAVRFRILRETESALLFGLLYPESAPRIPTVEVGRGGFSPDYAGAFWSATLGLDNDPHCGA